MLFLIPLQSLPFRTVSQITHLHLFYGQRVLYTALWYQSCSQPPICKPEGSCGHFVACSPARIPNSEFQSGLLRTDPAMHASSLPCQYYKAVLGLLKGLSILQRGSPSEFCTFVGIREVEASFSFVVIEVSVFC